MMSGVFNCLVLFYILDGTCFKNKSNCWKLDRKERRMLAVIWSNIRMDITETQT